ncbi:hypothetical protein [Clostridium sp.]|uniref:hypothetical protein n=1 Tax=Clostridium sp. TaxID=1506 RepID=UPI00284A45AC|nr:hypothetical protein [Clostridium sp.]MDR3594247.1 hypothetical protein [Clostridium sp.]
MRENIKNLLRDVNSKIEETDNYEWDTVRDMFTEVIKRKGLSKEEVEEINERILKDVNNKKKVKYGVSDK